MSIVPGDIDTGQGPPMTVPLRHFVVAVGFLVGATALAAADAALGLPGLAGLAHVHLLLAGWVCITIMGAMTQFVPVWSGVALHSRRLATAQLWLVAPGLLGMAGSFLLGALGWVHVFGTLALVGFWTFAYNLGRTLARVDGLDVTEAHFAFALTSFVAVTTLGFLLALSYATPVFAALPVARTGAVSAHATLAVFGAILTTVFGALYQLATMFTQTELHGVDHHCCRVESYGYPTGVLALAVGRLVGSVPLARVGGALVCLAVAGFAVLLARRLVETRVDWTPMLSRYAVVAVAMAAWSLLTAPAWLTDPLALAYRFGGPDTVHLLALGVVGFVVLGTLYHIVPFIVWVHRYSDLLGFEDVPMIDDLYGDRLAAADFGLFSAGTAGLVAADLLALPTVVAPLSGALVAAGTVVFAANLLSVLRNHSPQTLGGVLFASADRDQEPSEEAV
ncbi:hypothetical protein [Halorientalis regularis]|uniref:Uncharacterized protein n=1 Tax=Halorientalis regularis TaxID=660518 RepID=A0A1G7R5V3_9EURY|nr:hypothetical protein [Halorientalis regularis]SDG06118.1 hypothetical protein SAMN05216218_11464 [Halorientalis regularis]